jgi:hypothetical protein
LYISLARSIPISFPPNSNARLPLVFNLQAVPASPTLFHRGRPFRERFRQSIVVTGKLFVPVKVALEFGQFGFVRTPRSVSLCLGFGCFYQRNALSWFIFVAGFRVVVRELSRQSKFSGTNYFRGTEDTGTIKAHVRFRRPEGNEREKEIETVHFRIES